MDDGHLTSNTLTFSNTWRFLSCFGLINIIRSFTLLQKHARQHSNKSGHLQYNPWSFWVIIYLVVFPLGIFFTFQLWNRLLFRIGNLLTLGNVPHWESIVHLEVFQVCRSLQQRRPRVQLQVCWYHNKEVHRCLLNTYFITSLPDMCKWLYKQSYQKMNTPQML